MGVFKRDTRSLDYSSHAVGLEEETEHKNGRRVSGASVAVTGSGGTKGLPNKETCMGTRKYTNEL